MSKENKSKQKVDGRKGNGGKRSGSGRKSGSGLVTKNKTMRIPVDFMEEAAEKGIKNLTAFLVQSGREALKDFNTA